MDPALWELISDDEGVEGVEEIDGIVRLVDPEATVDRLRIISRFGRIATCRLRRDDVLQVRNSPNVASMKAARRVEAPATAEQSRRDLQPNPSDLRHPEGVGATGRGVIIGILDWGCDFVHASLRAGIDGPTRLRAIWDQRGGRHPNSPQPYGYGRVLHRRHIDAALSTGAPYDVLDYHPGDADRDSTGAHGMHVAAIAAGNGLDGGPIGIAPEAELVFVHLADKGTSGVATLGDSVRILEAVDFVAKLSGSMPWVINLSVGRHGGPHDGGTLVELAFDELLREAPGRFIVQSAGNYFAKRAHASGRLHPGSTRRLRVIVDPADVTPNEIEVWYPGSDVMSVRLSSPSGEATEWVRLGERIPFVEEGEIVGRLYHRAIDPNNGDNHIDIFLYPRASPGRWDVELRADDVVDGRYHAWVERDATCPGCQSRFFESDADPAYTIGTLANGRIPLVVGAYNPHKTSRPLSGASSSGPTRDGRHKPDLIAPGVAILAARSATPGSRESPNLLTRKSGTSMAAPHVTGTVALCLEALQRPLWADEIRQLILENADPATQLDPNRSGAGYLNQARALRAAQATSLGRRFGVFQTTRPKELAMTTVKGDSSPDESVPHLNLPTNGSEELSHEIGLGISPAVIYRRALYGDEAKLADLGLEVVGRPDHPATSPLRRGDLLLRVPLGEPGPGHLAVLASGVLVPDTDSHILSEAESAEPGFFAAVIEGGTWSHTAGDRFGRRILDQAGIVPSGQLLLRRNTRHDVGAGQATSESDSSTTHTDVAKDILVNVLFPNEPIMERVRIQDWSTMRHYPKLKQFSYQAWTHRVDLIYLRKLKAPNKATERDYLTIVMFHEAEHVRQFTQNVGNPPQSWEEMTRFEATAYRRTATWLQSKQAEHLIQSDDIRTSVAKDQDRYAQAFENAINEFANLGPRIRESRYRGFLMGRNSLGKGQRGELIVPRDLKGDPTTLNTLYGHATRTSPRRSPSEAGSSIGATEKSSQLVEPADANEVATARSFCERARAQAIANDEPSRRLIQLLSLRIARHEARRITERFRELTALFEGLNRSEKEALRKRLDDTSDPLGRFFVCELSSETRRRLRGLLDDLPAKSPTSVRPASPASVCLRPIGSMSVLHRWERELLAFVHNIKESEFRDVALLIGPILPPGLFGPLERLVVPIALRNGYAITIGSNIWFPDTSPSISRMGGLDTTTIGHLTWLTHESVHKLDYDRAGVDVFLQSYALQAASVGFRHDAIPMEERANRIEHAAEVLLQQHPQLMTAIATCRDAVVTTELQTRSRGYRVTLNKELSSWGNSDESGPSGPQNPARLEASSWPVSADGNRLGAIANEDASSAEVDEDALIVRGESENKITNELFFGRHPEIERKPLRRGTPLVQQWLAIRNDVVRPAMRRRLIVAPLDAVHLATFLSQYEDDERVPPSVRESFLTGSPLLSMGKSLRDLIVTNWKAGRRPLTTDRLFRLAVDISGDVGTATHICHNVLKAFARGGSAICWEKIPQDPAERRTGCGSSFVWTDQMDPQAAYYTDGVRVIKARRIHRVGRDTWPSRSKASIFYVLFDPDELGQFDPGDWYHYFVCATVSALGTLRRLALNSIYPASDSSASLREGGRVEGLSQEAYMALLGNALAGLFGQMLNPDWSQIPPYQGWVLANALSFLEGGYYGKASQGEVNRESRSQLKGANFGVAVGGAGPVPQEWPWYTPIAESLSRDELMSGFTLMQKTAEVLDPAGAPFIK